MTTEKPAFYKKILLTTDLTKNSVHIAKRAREIADLTQADLHIVHVLAHTPIANGGEFSMPIDVELEEILKQQAKQHLTALADSIQVNPESQHLLEGSVKNAVTQLADEISANLIIVGTHSHHGLGALLGSQANAILHSAKCDVWTIRV